MDNMYTMYTKNKMLIIIVMLHIVIVKYYTPQHLMLINL